MYIFSLLWTFLHFVFLGVKLKYFHLDYVCFFYLQSVISSMSYCFFFLVYFFFSSLYFSAFCISVCKIEIFPYGICLFFILTICKTVHVLLFSFTRAVILIGWTKSHSNFNVFVCNHVNARLS